MFQTKKHNFSVCQEQFTLRTKNRSILHHFSNSFFPFGVTFISRYPCICVCEYICFHECVSGEDVYFVDL